MLKAAIIGLGGISVSHRKAFVQLKKMGKAELACAYDVNPEAMANKKAINIDSDSGADDSFNFYTDLDKMLECEKIDFVLVCVPTYLHSEITVDLLNRGYNVLCEKPMALNSKDCKKMIDAANKSGKKLMIGQCLRFLEAHDYIKSAIDDGRYGKLLGAFLERLSSPPVWGYENWFMDPSLSGGCLTDLHIHDLDLVRYLLGEPSSVSCRANTSICVNDSVHSTLIYDGVPVTAIGDWTLTGMDFQANSRFNFEKATLLSTKGGKELTVYSKDGSESYNVQISKNSAYFGELSYFCDFIEGKIENTKNPPESAMNTIRLIEALRESAERSGEFVPFSK